MRRTAQKSIASLNQVTGKTAAPKGSFLASKRTGSLGHFQSFKLGGFQIDNDRFEGTAALVRNGPE